MFYIQLIGILAFCIVVLSFYKKTQKQILIYQSTSNFAYFVHYFLLGALSGAFLSAINIIRNILFATLNNKKKIIFIIILALYIIITVVFYEKIYSIFPLCANTIYMLSLLKDTKKSILIGAIISSSLWLFYSIFVLSYAGVITESILVISNIFQLIKIKRIRAS